MLSFSEARQLAESQIPRLRDKFKSHDIVLIDKYIKENARGWTFVYNTQKSEQTGLPQDGLVGNGPILVDKLNGNVFILPSGGWKRMLAKYEATGEMDNVLLANQN